MSITGDDISGNGHHAIVFGAIPTTDRFGQDSSAFYFDGLDDYLELPATNTMKPVFPLSISVWVQMDAATLNNIFTNNFDMNTYHGAWINVNSSGYVGLTYGDGGPCSPSSRRSKNGTSVIPAGTWTHLVGVIRSATDMDICVNGVDDGGSYSGSGGSLTYSSNPGRIGSKDALTTAPPNYFKGKIDDLRFWNRALTKPEVEILFNETPTAVSGVDNNLIEVWPNPVVNTLHVQVPHLGLEAAHLRLHDPTGKIVFQWNEVTSVNNGPINLDTSKLAKGSYYLVCELDGQWITKKVILQ